MPAGWYVVEGDVTITPRLDTHGAVNLILKDDCHLTVPWGINVKEGDTFSFGKHTVTFVGAPMVHWPEAW